jgi:exonuclease SbcC
MRFARVRAHDFGPLHNCELVLAPGITVVHGPNEAGKSTWHAALYAGLCGVRRTRGRQPPEDRDFRERHKPWTAARWRVTATVSLEDGRCVELQHDLDGKVDCRARDVSVGRDYSNEIMFEGAPDGSRWLGLDRRSFLATACVRQSELLQVKDDASALQHHLQRAADTAGVDQTAAVALERIDAFRAENVGQMRANSNRPLPRAQRALDDAHREVRRARAEHAEYLKMIAEADRLQQQAQAAERRLQLFRAAVASQRAQVEAARLSRARQLQSLVPRGAPTPLAEDDAVAQHARTALDAWRRRPDVKTTEGESVDTLRTQLTSLPQVPSGELTPDPRVLRAREALADADTRLADHAATAPAILPEAEAAAPLTPPQPQHSRSNIPLIVGGVLSLAGLALIAIGLLIVGIGLMVLGVSVGLVLFLNMPRPAAEPATAQQGRGSEKAAAAERPLEAWHERARRLDAARAAAIESLAEALRSRGVSAEGEARAALEASYELYVRKCAERGQTATHASRRLDLEARLRDREQADTAAAEARRQIATAREALLESAQQCGIDADSESEMVDQLDRWLTARSARLADDEQLRSTWTELRTLLGDDSLEDLAAHAAKLTADADKLNVGLTGSIELETDVDGQRTALERAVTDTHQAADLAVGMAQERRRVVPAVADAEEAVARAEAELEAVRRLDSVLERTREFLSRAQDRVHRDIAPVLASGLEQWLPRVTANRYTRAIVDPETLDVQISGSDDFLRYAHLLSHGTAEQVYLLLRAIMAQHLTQPGEVCPLVLDDVTSHCDSERQRAVLDVLHEISGERQVILFAQEDAVLAWAKTSLVEPGDRLVELDRPIPLTS